MARQEIVDGVEDAHAAAVILAAPAQRRGYWIVVRLELLQELRFDCSRCGDCCTGGWNVLLGVEEAERIAGADLGPGGPGEDPPRVVRRRDGRARLGRHEDGACVFLGGERQCLLHERLGEAAKPLACRLYPFHFAPLGDAVGVDVAFSCRAVAEDRGRPLGERL